MKLDGVMIWVPDVPATVAFYQAAFGLEIEMLDAEQGFAMLRTGETTLQFADERAVAAGAVVEVALADKPWGQTLGYVRDLNGCLVELSSPSAW